MSNGSDRLTPTWLPTSLESLSIFMQRLPQRKHSPELTLDPRLLLSKPAHHTVCMRQSKQRWVENLNWRVQATTLLLYLSYLQTGAQTAFLTGKRPTTTQGSYSNTGTYYKVQHCTSLITRSVHIKGEHAHHNYSKGSAMEESQGSCFHKISE